MRKILKEPNLLFLVEAGKVEGAFIVRKFGRNPVVGTTPEDVWIAGGLYNWIPTGQKLYISSSEDTDLGDIVIEGLDANWEIQSETITLTGETVKITLKDWIRVDRVYNDSDTEFDGDIYVNMENDHTLGVPDDATKIVAKILYDAIYDHNQTLQAIYTIPARHTAFVIEWSISTKKGDDAQILPQIRLFEKTFRTQNYVSVYQSSENYLSYYAIIPEKSDIKLLGVSSVASSEINGQFKLLVIPNKILADY